MLYYESIGLLRRAPRTAVNYAATARPLACSGDACWRLRKRWPRCALTSRPF
ncbi:hypothetical protein ACOBR2_20540 [Telmatobacter bradus]|uniref:hypothetical protein n=1 Tax=Telmatobacter bradus TaxID=474953 RepID=UPI003B4374A2